MKEKEKGKDEEEKIENRRVMREREGVKGKKERVVT